MSAAPLPDAFDRDLSVITMARGITPPSVEIVATPYRWRDASTIPQRPWVYGRKLLRNTVAVIAAPGGVGKSSYVVGSLLALATGRNLLGEAVWDGPKRAWYWNLEDDGEELARQVQAAAKYHGITSEDCGDRLYIDSGPDGAILNMAETTREGFTIVRPVIDALAAQLLSRSIDVFVVDPFVSSHSVGENDNGAIDAVTKEWARLANRANCSIVLVHHTRKLAGMKVTGEAARGASSLIAAARSTLVLNRMSDDEAARFGIEGEDEIRRLFTVQDDKHNRAPAEKAEWYRMESVDLGNGGLGSGDSIGVVTKWNPPDAFEGVTVSDLLKVQKLIDGGEWRASSQAKQWAGNAVGDALGIDVGRKAGKAKVTALLREWKRNKAFREVEKQDPSTRKTVPFLEVFQWADDNALPH